MSGPASKKGVTDASGVTISGLPPGTYMVFATATGFKPGRLGPVALPFFSTVTGTFRCGSEVSFVMESA
jgi:hypothetical protein